MRKYSMSSGGRDLVKGMLTTRWLVDDRCGSHMSIRKAGPLRSPCAVQLLCKWDLVTLIESKRLGVKEDPYRDRTGRRFWCRCRPPESQHTPSCCLLYSRNVLGKRERVA
jgi:hypothetical protein